MATDEGRDPPEPRYEDAPIDPEWEADRQFSAPPRGVGRAASAQQTQTAPPLMSSPGDTEVEGYEAPLAWALSRTLQRLAPQRRPPSGAPGQGVACATCPVSIWFVAPNMVRCHCPPLMVVTWETGQSQLEVSLCDARERAIELEMQRQLDEVDPS